MSAQDDNAESPHLAARKVALAPATSSRIAGSSSGGDSLRRVPFWVWICLIAVLCILQFSNTLHGDLLFDDGVAIIQNKNAHWGSDWKGVFTQDLWGRNMFEPGSHLSYRPLTTISFRFNHYFHELRPFGYHVVNIALHAAVTVLFTVATRRMLRSTLTSVLAGILFAVHPLHVEVATNIVGRAESLAALCFLFALLLFLPAAAAPRPAFARVFAAWLCICIGVFCKEQCVTVVGVCAVWEVVRLLQEWHKDEEATAEAQDNIRESASSSSPELPPYPRMRQLVTCALLRWSCFTLLALSLILFRLRFNDHKPASFAPEENPARLVDEWQTRVLTWSYLVPVNAFMLVVPHPLLCDWGHDTIPIIKSFLDSRNIITFLFFIALILVTYRLLRVVLRTRARSPAIFVGVCWTAITFLPASNLFFPVGFVVADRVLYTPSMGSCILLAHAASELYLKRKSQQSRLLNLVSSLLLLFLLLLPVAYFARTWIRNIDWYNGVNLWTSALRVNSGNPKFWLGLAHAKGEEGSKGLEEGIDYLYTAVALRGTYVEAYYNLGTSALQVGRLQEAKQALSTAILLVPEHAGAYSNLGTTLYNMKDYGAAVDIFERLLEFQPNDLGHYTNLGSSLVMLDDFAEAERVYMHVVQNKPYDPVGFLNLGLCRAKAKDVDGAEAAFLQALQLSPSDDAVMFNLAVLYANNGMEDDVRSTLHQLLQVNPDHPGARAMASRLSL